jgi:arsenite methyltransferase
MTRTPRSRAIFVVLAACVLSCSFVGCSALKRFGYEGFGRDGWQQPERVVRELGITPGMQVADLGAGGGYFTFRLADAVVPGGRVYAVDVDADMTVHLEERARDEGRAEVSVILAAPDDPLLPDGQLDLVFTSNTYHHIPVDVRVAYFRALRSDLAPGGRVAILDLREGPFFAREHFTDRETIVAEMVAAGYVERDSFDFIEKQSFTIFSLE